MKNKKAITVIVIIIISIIGVTSYTLKKNNTKGLPVTSKKETTSTAKELTIKEKVIINIYDEVPNVEFFLERKTDDKLTINFEGITTEKIYYDNKNNIIEKEKAFKNNILKENYKEKEVISTIGEFNVIIKSENDEYHSTLIVLDKESPLLELKELNLKEGEKYTIEDFITSCEDNSKKECEIKYKDDKMGEYSKKGTYDIEIIAKDNSNNEITKKTKLKIFKNEATNSNNKNNTSTTSNINTNINENTNTNNNESTNSKNNSNKYEIKEETTTNEEIKYGATIITTTKTKYKVYEDGSKEKINSSSSTKYDKATFNASTNEMKKEATENVKKYSNEINQVLKKVNEYRSEVDAEPLLLDHDLSVAASIRALELGYGLFSHTRPNGSDCFTVIDELNYVYYALGENIASGYKTANDVSLGWKNSQGHYENMISSDFHKIGIGVVKTDQFYWVQMFSD